MNSHLPQDVAVIRAAEVAPDFDVRGTAKEKTYKYSIWNSSARSPHRAHNHWHMAIPLDPSRMQLASDALVGEHDFTAYRTSQCQAKHAIRRITSISIHGETGQAIHIEVRGNAFLHNMVRIIAGTLSDVGRGHLNVNAAGRALKEKDRALAGQTAPGHGLTLVRVDYSVDPFAEASCWP